MVLGYRFSWSFLLSNRDIIIIILVTQNLLYAVLCFSAVNFFCSTFHFAFHRGSTMDFLSTPNLLICHFLSLLALHFRSYDSYLSLPFYAVSFSFIFSGTLQCLLVYNRFHFRYRIRWFFR